MTNPSSISHETLEDFTTALGAKTSVPGGGAAAGSALAHGAGLGGMVVAFSLGKKSLAEHQEILESTGDTLATIRARSLTLGDEDARAFAALSATWTASPPVSVQDQIAAIRAAMAPPLETITQAGTAAEALATLVGRSNPRLVSDLAIGAGFVALSADAAAWNVEMNLDALRALPGEDASLNVESSETEGMVGQIRVLCDRIIASCRTAPSITITE